jgi:hypothetical protein
MRLFVTALACTFALAATPGCKKKEEKKEPTVAQPAPEAPKPEAPKPAETMPNKQKNCPNAVEGATTEVAERDGVVLVTILAEAPEAITEIQSRAKHLSDVQGKAAEKIEHTGDGTGGAAGKCPVFVKDTTIEVKTDGNGVVVMVKPNDAAKLADLKAEIQKRADAGK